MKNLKKVAAVLAAAMAAKVMKETQTTSPAHRLRSQMKMVSTLQPGTSQVTVPAQSNS